MFIQTESQCAMSKRVLESTLKEVSAVAKPRAMNLVSKNFLIVKKHPPQDLSDPNSLVNQRLDQSGVVARSRKLLRDSNQNPTMYSQERQQGDAQASSTWNQERRDESSNSAGARKLSARGEDNQFGKSQLHFHNMQISDYPYREKVSKTSADGYRSVEDQRVHLVSV